MKIYYGGHSSFLLESNNNRILVDPMMISAKMAEKKPTLIAVSHGHGDHIGDSEKIAKKNNKCFVISKQIIIFAPKK